MKRDAETLSRKKAIHPKGEAAKARRSVLEAKRRNREDRERVDEQWHDAEGNKAHRAAKKREEEAKKRGEAAARKAMTDRLAEQEARDLQKTLMKKPSPKISQEEAQLRRRKELEQQQRWQEEYMKKLIEEEAKRKQSRIVDEEEYKRMVHVSNKNRWHESVMEEKRIEEAIGQIRMQEYWPTRIRHGMKQIKATHPGKSRKALVCLAGNDGQRALLVDAGGIYSNRSNLEFYEYYSLDDLEGFEDPIDDYQNFYYY
ncbi:coiled-coil domain-containing protein 124-like [Coffea eugenioides]|uniref:coiled-coil domain-containing protein 124-like n=1 Tax=Coffea eugenioides TaxID=49369 RepID=UPI000F6103ED|nr:coiled-coil domain-containing protein 124-like [Coffea eugenioides]